MMGRIILVAAVAVAVVAAVVVPAAASSSSSSSSLWWTFLLTSSPSSTSDDTTTTTTTLISFILGDLYTALYTLLVLIYLFSRLVYEYEIVFVGGQTTTSATNNFIVPIVLRKKDRTSNKNDDGLSSKRLPVDVTTTVDDENDTEKKPIDLTGDYQLVENINFEAFLGAQGVPWALRRAANGARPVHKITHHSSRFITIQICGIIESSTTYEIGGPPVLGQVRGRNFSDQVQYMTLQESKYDIIRDDQEPQKQPQSQQPSRQENTCNGGDDQEQEDDSEGESDGNGRDRNGTTTAEGGKENVADNVVVGIQTTKRALDDGYTVVVQRRLFSSSSPESGPESSGQGSDVRGGSSSSSSRCCKIIMTSSVTFDDPARHAENVVSKQIFERV